MIRHAIPPAALWAILAGPDGWAFGIPCVLLASIASCLLLPPLRLSIPGLLAFAPYFAWSSVRAGFDVAALALHPRMPIDPALVRYEMRLDGRIARVVMANAVTLLPGTLSVDLQGAVLSIHVLNARGPFQASVERLEARVAALFREMAHDGDGRSGRE